MAINCLLVHWIYSVVIFTFSFPLGLLCDFLLTFMHFPTLWLVQKFISFLHETKKSSCTTFFEIHFEILKLGSLIQTFIRSLPVRIWPDFSKSQKKSLCWNFSFPTVCERRKIHQNPGSFRNLYHFSRAAYYLTIWFGTKTLQKSRFHPHLL